MVALFMLTALAGAAQGIDLPRPADREFVVDRASLVGTVDHDRIMETCTRLLTERGIPIIVVTVQSMSAHLSGGNCGIETFARMLFDQWGVGRQTINGVSWNRGILFLISRADRKARIELGADWDRSYDGVCQSIMNDTIIPSFRAGNYSGGIAAGVQGLDQMARGLRPPSRSWDFLHLNEPMPSLWMIPVVAVLLVLLRIWRFFAGGWGGGYYGRGYYGGGYYDSGSSGGSSFSGGSFDGGSSGGGGATGSW